MKYVRKLRCRLDYCDPDQDPDPIPGLIALYREMDWDYVCRIGPLFLFCTQDSRAPEPHTDLPDTRSLFKATEGPNQACALLFRLDADRAHPDIKRPQMRSFYMIHLLAAKTFHSIFAFLL